MTAPDPDATAQSRRPHIGALVVLQSSRATKSGRLLRGQHAFVTSASSPAPAAAAAPSSAHAVAAGGDEIDESDESDESDENSVPVVLLPFRRGQKPVPVRLDELSVVAAAAAAAAAAGSSGGGGSEKGTDAPGADADEKTRHEYTRSVQAHSDMLAARGRADVALQQLDALLRSDTAALFEEAADDGGGGADNDANDGDAGGESAETEGEDNGVDGDDDDAPQHEHGGDEEAEDEEPVEEEEEEDGMAREWIVATRADALRLAGRADDALAVVAALLAAEGPSAATGGHPRLPDGLREEVRCIEVLAHAARRDFGAAGTALEQMRAEVEAEAEAHAGGCCSADGVCGPGVHVHGAGANAPEEGGEEAGQDGGEGAGKTEQDDEDNDDEEGEEAKPAIARAVDGLLDALAQNSTAARRAYEAVVAADASRADAKRQLGALLVAAGDATRGEQLLKEADIVSRGADHDRDGDHDDDHAHGHDHEHKHKDGHEHEHKHKDGHEHDKGHGRGDEQEKQRDDDALRPGTLVRLGDLADGRLGAVVALPPAARGGKKRAADGGNGGSRKRRRNGGVTADGTAQRTEVDGAAGDSVTPTSPSSAAAAPDASPDTDGDGDRVAVVLLPLDESAPPLRLPRAQLRSSAITAAAVRAGEQALPRDAAEAYVNAVATTTYTLLADSESEESEGESGRACAIRVAQAACETAAGVAEACKQQPVRTLPALLLVRWLAARAAGDEALAAVTERRAADIDSNAARSVAAQMKAAREADGDRARCRG